MKYVIILLVMALAMPLVALDPYIMTLEECRAYIKANNLKWEAGVTPYTNMPKETLKMMLTGMYLPIESKTKNSNHIVNSNTKNPEYLDWTNVGGTNWMTSVKNQASCGSCWAFAVMGTWEAMININSNNSNIDWDASEQYMVSTCYSGGSCGGGPAGTGPANWVKANGVPDEACYPYKAANSNCNERCSDWASRLKYIKTVTNVCTSANTEAIKAALRNGPVGTAMQAT
ncbi:MAG: hypothetical protein JXA60_09405, partial [Candidatus Coatesbacteria bacterium]|nr:hypothetical protein [Candidatus Coatesbacteria bacterium]